MIAFKTFKDCPEDQRIADIPLEFPWIEQSVDEAGAVEMMGIGFTVMNHDDYTSYKNEVMSTNLMFVSKLKMEFGQTLLQQCLIIMGATDSTTDDVIATLEALGPIKSLLETGALTTAKDVINSVLPGFTGPIVGVLQYAVDEIVGFGY
jgi:hypothetical protein